MLNTSLLYYIFVFICNICSYNKNDIQYNSNKNTFIKSKKDSEK